MLRKKVLSLVLVRNEKSVLLGLKKRGFGVGKWNGFGGKVESGETLVDAAKRELFEECSLTTNSLHKIGHIIFEFVDDPVLMDVHIFMTTEYEGEPQESDEMMPKWFDIEEIPYAEMWADDRLWYPLFLKGAKFEGYFKFLGHEKIIDFTLNEVQLLKDQEFGL